MKDYTKPEEWVPPSAFSGTNKQLKLLREVLAAVADAPHEPDCACVMTLNSCTYRPISIDPATPCNCRKRAILDKARKEWGV